MTPGGDHDPPAKRKLVPFGIRRRARGALTLDFGSRETRDAGVEALRRWGRPARPGLGPGKRLVIAPDNGPKHSGRRTPFRKRMVEFADWSGWEVRRVSSPPSPSQSNRIERC